MVTEIDHVEALRKRLLNRQKEKEAELREIQEMIRVLGDAPAILAGKSRASQEQSSVKPSARYNINLSKDVDEYLMGYPWDQAINIKGMIATLKAEKGVKGKDDSLYAYIHGLLKKKADKKEIHYEKGVGFFKSRKGSSDRSDSVLVAQL